MTAPETLDGLTQGVKLPVASSAKLPKSSRLRLEFVGPGGNARQSDPSVGFLVYPACGYRTASGPLFRASLEALW